MKITDKMRLDWISNRRKNTIIWNRDSGTWSLERDNPFTGAKAKRIRGLRNAIDAAITAERRAKNTKGRK